MAEGTVLIAAVAVANALLAPDDPGLVKVSPHPTLFVTLMIAARYGFTPGLIVAGMSTVAYGAALFAFTGVPTFLHLLSAPYSTPVVLLIPSAVILGTLSQQHISRLAKSEAERVRLAEQYEKIKAEHANLRDVNVELADKVVGAGETLSTLYRYAKQLNVGDLGKIYEGLTNMIKEVVEADVVSVWMVARGKLELAARAGQDTGSGPPRIDEKLAKRFDRHGILAVHDVPESERPKGTPYVTGKITAGRGGPLVAYLTIDQLPFTRYTPEAIRLFMIAVDWASQSVGNAMALNKPPAAAVPAAVTAPVSAPAPVPAPAAQARRPTRGLETLLADARKSLTTPGARHTASRPARIPGGLNTLLADADQLLGKLEKPPVSPSVDEEMLDELERTRMLNAPLGDLLGEIGGFLASQKKR